MFAILGKSAPVWKSLLNVIHIFCANENLPENPRYTYKLDVCHLGAGGGLGAPGGGDQASAGGCQGRDALGIKRGHQIARKTRYKKKQYCRNCSG